MNKKLSQSAILTAMSLMLIFLTSLFKFSTIAIMSATSIIIILILILNSPRYAIISFFATTLLGFLIVPNKLIMFNYLILFGSYPLIKFYIEKINNLKLEWLLKIIYFFILSFLIYKFANSFINFSNKEILILFVPAILAIFDYFLSKVAQYVHYYIQKRK